MILAADVLRTQGRRREDRDEKNRQTRTGALHFRRFPPSNSDTDQRKNERSYPGTLELYRLFVATNLAWIRDVKRK